MPDGACRTAAQCHGRCRTVRYLGGRTTEHLARPVGPLGIGVRLVLLENVKGILDHPAPFQEVLDAIRAGGYNVTWRLCNARMLVP